MSVIIRLQNLPLTASSIDIRNFFDGLSIPDGGVHIVGGPEGDAFIAFSTDEDARQAMRLNGRPLKGSGVSLLLSSRNEMYKVIEQARLGPMSGPSPQQQQQQQPQPQHLLTSSSSSHMGNSSGSSPSNHHHLSSQVSSSTNNHYRHGYNQSGNNSVSSSMSPTSSGSAANDYLRSFAGGNLTSGASTTGTGGAQADLSSNPALLFSTMTAIPSATLGGANAFLGHGHGHGHHGQPQQQHQLGVGQAAYSGIHSSPSTHHQHQQQNQNSAGPATGLPFGSGNANAAATMNAFANGNPFLVPPPSLANVNLPFPANLLSASNAAAAAQSNPLAGLTTAPNSASVMGLSSNVMNPTMSIAGQQQPTSAPPMNPFSNPPPRLNMMSNGGLSGLQSTVPQTGHSHTPNLPGAGVGPRLNNFGSPGMHNNTYGAGVGATNHPAGHMGMGIGNRPQLMGINTRPPFGNMGNNGGNMGNNNLGGNKRGFEFGAIPSGRAEIVPNNRDNDIRARQRSRSRSRERRERLAGRRRSRSRERDRTAERRRRKSRSNSRSRSRDRTGKPSRRDSREKRNDPERRSRSDSSPDKSSQDSSDPRSGRNKREHEPSPTPNSMNTTTEEWPGAKLTGIPTDASYREIKEFIRAEVMGGSDGVVRLYDEGVAFLKLQNAPEFPRVFRSNGRKLRGSAITIEGITMETWTQEYKLNKSRIERDIDREKEERERENAGRGRGGGADRERDHHHNNRSERHNSHHGSNSNSSTSHHRSSRFSNASQSSCIAIRGLAPTITKQELVSRYLQETPCQDIVLIAAPIPTNRHSVTAFIQFESAQIAQQIIDVIARSPLGTTLVVESCDVDDLQKAKARTSGGPGGMGPGNNRGPAQTGGMQDSQTKSIFELDLGLDDETTTVIMKGAPPNITERDVFDFFSDIGLAPMNVRILYDTDGQCSGQVICEFPDNNKAKRATTKDGMLFGRGQISVSLLPSRNTTRGANSGNAGEFGQSNNFIRNPRPGLLGPPPLRGQGSGGGGGAPAAPGMPRFPTPTGSPNIFEQALQQQSGPGPVRPNMGGQGGRPPRGPNPGGNERMSRFSGNNSRNDFRNQNGMGRGRPNNSHQNNKKEDPQIIVNDDDMALFNKKGCVIGLENIPYKASMDDILQYLEEILKIRIAPDRIIRRYDDMQKPTGDARVAFDTEFEAKLACDRLSGTYMWKRPISAAVIE